MRMMQICLLVIAVLAREGAGYNYGENGPDTWFLDAPKCGNGLRQSPVGIDDWNAVYDPKLKSFSYWNYEKKLRWNVTHDGKTVYFRPLHSDADKLRFVTSSLDSEVYKCEQLHFHWGMNNHQGSEHWIDGRKYPLEVHLVHTSANQTKTAVLAFLFNISSSENPSLAATLRLVKEVYNTSFSVGVELMMEDFIPLDVRQGSYYRYNGSLTTPPCTEGITWTLFETPIKISSDQLDVFHNNSAKKNFRDPQRLYRRPITSSRKKRRDNPEAGSILQTIKPTNNEDDDRR